MAERPPARGTWQPGSGNVSEEARAIVEARKQKQLLDRMASEAEVRANAPPPPTPPRPSRSRLPYLAGGLVILALVSAALNLRRPAAAQRPPDIKQSFADILPMTRLDALSGRGWVVHASTGWEGLRDRAVATRACAELQRRLTPERGQRLIVVDGDGEPVIDCIRPSEDLRAQ